MNLCINARDAMSRGGRLQIETENIILGDDRDSRYLPKTPGEYILIRVIDDGEGIPPEIQSRIFEPFFTTKDGDRGSGLGLSIVKRIVESYGGAVSVSSEPGKGSVFEIVLPASDGEVERCDAPLESDIPYGDETILLVDDEEIIRHMAKRMIEKFGYRIESASNGEEAVAMVESGERTYDLVILDLVMPRMDGRKTFEALRRINPGIKVLLASGTDLTHLENGSMSGLAGFIQKPFMEAWMMKPNPSKTAWVDGKDGSPRRASEVMGCLVTGGYLQTLLQSAARPF
jgi:CheY-like chemotaxis protein